MNDTRIASRSIDSAAQPETAARRDTSSGLSAIVVSYNSAQLLPECFRSLREAAGDADLEIVVVDNGSTDGSIDLLRKEWKPERLLRAERNTGFGPANNAGAEVARGRYYLLVNTDCFVRPGLFEALVARMEADPDVAVAGPRLLNPDGTLQPSCHNFPTPLVLLLEQSLLWKPLRRVPFLRDRLMIAGHHARPREADWLAGACLLVRPQAFREVGGFDPRYFFYWEEADLCLRLRRRGWKTVFEPAAEAVHLGGGSSTDPALLTQFFTSLYLFYSEHYSPLRQALARAIVRGMALFKAVRAAVHFGFSILVTQRVPGLTKRRRAKLAPADADVDHRDTRFGSEPNPKSKIQNLKSEVDGWLAVARL